MYKLLKSRKDALTHIPIVYGYFSQKYMNTIIINQDKQINIKERYLFRKTKKCLGLLFFATFYFRLKLNRNEFWIFLWYLFSVIFQLLYLYTRYLVNGFPLEAFFPPGAGNCLYEPTKRLVH